MKQIADRNVIDVDAREGFWLRLANGAVDHVTLLAMWAYAIWPMAALIALAYAISPWLPEWALMTALVLGAGFAVWRYATTLKRLADGSEEGARWFAVGRRLFGLAPKYAVKSSR